MKLLFRMDKTDNPSKPLPEIRYSFLLLPLISAMLILSGYVLNLCFNPIVGIPVGVKEYNPIVLSSLEVKA